MNSRRRGRRYFNRRKDKENEKAKEVQEPKAPPAPPKTYAVLFYKTLEEATNQQATIQSKAKEVDLLNVVIDSENIPEEKLPLEEFCRLYFGNAWTAAHKRRVEEGWYNSPH
jgi:hypothetical protein